MSATVATRKNHPTFEENVVPTACAIVLADWIARTSAPEPSTTPVTFAMVRGKIATASD